MYGTPHAMAVFNTLQPRVAPKKHITSLHDVPEGTGVVGIGDEKKSVAKDMLVESPARIPHEWTSESSSVFRVIVANVPKPAIETKLL
jgi:mannose-6-phosphate isomerase-like protein (cupin superfamily)